MLRYYIITIAVFSFIIISSISSVQAQCSSSQMHVNASASCNGTANLYAYVNSGSAMK